MQWWLAFLSKTCTGSVCSTYSPHVLHLMVSWSRDLCPTTHVCPMLGLAPPTWPPFAGVCWAWFHQGSVPGVWFWSCC